MWMVAALYLLAALYALVGLYSMQNAVGAEWSSTSATWVYSVSTHRVSRDVEPEAGMAPPVVVATSVGRVCCVDG